MAKKVADKTTKIEDSKVVESVPETTKKQDTIKQEEKVVVKKSLKKGVKKVRGSNYKKAKLGVKANKQYSIDEAIKLVKDLAYTNFVSSLETHIVLGIDSKKNEQRVRFTTSLPYSIGKTVKILVITNSPKDVKAAENVLVKDKSVVDDIISNKLVPNKDFNVVIATMDVMKDIAKVAKVLGPKGMMPSPKNGTITNDIEKAIKDLSKGQIEIKTQNNHSVIHQALGKLSLKDTELKANFNQLLTDLNKSTPAKLKTKFVQKVYLCSSMGPSIKVLI